MKSSLLFVVLLWTNSIFAQNVGINTDGLPPTDSRAMLEVKKGSYSKVKVRSLSYTDTSVVELSNRTVGIEGTDYLLNAIREEGLFFTTTSDLPGNIKDSLFTLRTNGRVGIGIRSPFYNMQLHEPTLTNAYLNITNSNTGIGANSGLLVGMQGSSAIINNLESNTLRLGTANLTRMIIDASGDVGIGNLSPAYRLDVTGDINLTNTLRVNGSPGTAGQVLMSNGASDPQWSDAALANDTRFCVVFSRNDPGTSSFSTGGTMSISATRYNLNATDITISASSITVNRSGLYHIGGVFDAILYYNGAVTPIAPPEITTQVNIVNVLLVNYHVNYDQAMRRQRTTVNPTYIYNSTFGFDIYIQAGKTISMYSLIDYLDGPTNSSFQEATLWGHLISE